MTKTLRSWPARVVTVFACIAMHVAAGDGQPPSAPSPELYKQLRWRYIGPDGNRVSAVAGVAGNPLIYYAGSASGGIFKTTDGGNIWEPVFDDQPVSSVGALAVAPSDPNIVWAGTGEGDIRSHISVGEGIFRSTDAGRTWTRTGLERTARISAITIHPTNPEIVLACALGHAYGPQPERGVFRTMDGGKTWERVLFVDENTGCSTLVMDPSNPRKMFAGMWQIDIKTWGRESGGPGSGLFLTKDGGTTWQRLVGHGLPGRPTGKHAVAIARSNPNRVYALIETGDGVPWHERETDRGQIWRSDNGGETWQVVSDDRNAMGRTHYYTHVYVAPDNEHETYYLTQALSTSIDDGRTLLVQTGRRSPGGDHHDMWIDPTNADRMIVAHDQGVSISMTRGRSWLRVRLPNAQMYHVTVDNQVPYYVYGNKQDGLSYRAPSNSRLESTLGWGDGIPRAMWHTVGGGECGWATPDPVDPNMVWSSGCGDSVVLYEESRRQARNIKVWPEDTRGVPAGLKYRFNWTTPLTISPHDRHTVYVGSQHVHRTANGGQTWEVISPDLTLNDKNRQQISGGLTPDNIGVEYGGVVFAIAESPRQKGLIWIGTNDGLVQMTQDGGKRWTNVTANIPNLPPWGTVSNIEPSHYDAGTAYLTVDFHQVNNRDPFVFKTTDYGKTWTAITHGIPRTMLSYAHCITEDPVRRGLLYLGTENAIYVSFDDGGSWQPLQMNLPHAPVYWITVQEHFNDLVIATYGRGFWILDDITALRQLVPAVLAESAHLFQPRPAYRFRSISPVSAQEDEPSAGENPVYGASINYFLNAVPPGNITVAILNQRGDTVRTLAGTKVLGLNRISWNLRYDRTKEAKLRTSPLYAPDVVVGPEGWRPLPTNRSGLPGGVQGRIDILAPPGTYTVKLSVGGRDYTQPLTVLKDPHSAGSDADIQEQMKLLLELRSSLEAAIDILNQLELVRSQIYNLERVIDDAVIKKAGRELDQKLIDLEWKLVDLRETGRGQDANRWGGGQLISKIQGLANGLASGDFKPTDAELEVRKLLSDELQTYRRQLEALIYKDLEAFNDLLRKRNVSNIVVRPPS